MQQFQLENVTECECSHVNIREENHGEEKVLAVDLAFWKEGGNELLDLFHPEIRTTLYCNRAAQEGQETLPDLLAVLPNLRLSGLPDRMHWGGNDKFAGYRLSVDYGLGGEESNVDLTECVLAGLKGQKAFVQLIAPPVLQLVKGKSGGKVIPGAGDAEAEGDLLADGDDDGAADEDTPEKALERAAAGG